MLGSEILMSTISFRHLVKLRSEGKKGRGNLDAAVHSRQGRLSRETDFKGIPGTNFSNLLKGITAMATMATMGAGVVSASEWASEWAWALEWASA